MQNKMGIGTRGRKWTSKTLFEFKVRIKMNLRLQTNSRLADVIADCKIIVSLRGCGLFKKEVKLIIIESIGLSWPKSLQGTCSTLLKSPYPWLSKIGLEVA